jgi:hypothetical protein
MIPIATIRTHDDLIAAFRIVKEQLGLSNAWCDDVGGFTRGQTDKVLGPTRTRGLSPMSFDTLCAAFAVRLEVVADPDQVRKMRPRWEGRDKSQVRVTGRISQELIERAKGPILQAFAKRANAARNAMLTREQRSRIAQKAARIRWKRHRAKRRAASRPPAGGGKGLPEGV